MNAEEPLIDPSTAVLAPFVAAGILDTAALQVAGLIGRTTGADPTVVLATALAVRALSYGHICIEPATVAGSVAVDQAPDITAETIRESLPWPDPRQWTAAIASSPAVWCADRARSAPTTPLVWDGTRVYLQRYWQLEQRLARSLLDRCGQRGSLAGVGSTPAPAVDAQAVDAAPEHCILDHILDQLFESDQASTPNFQRVAAEQGLHRRLTVIAGGPGTGKTRTVARLLASCHWAAWQGDHRILVALAAPTGKASARLSDAVRLEATTAPMPEAVAEILRSTEATTVHRLLGIGRRGTPRHHRADPLPHDMVIVDETSMMSLPLMTRLLDALREDANLVLVGDPFQLASVEAGTVLADLVGPLSTGSAMPARPVPPESAQHTHPLAADIVVLRRVHRFGAETAIAALADAVRSGDADRAMGLLQSADDDQLRWIDAADTDGIDHLRQSLNREATQVVQLAGLGDVGAALAAATDGKVLCATRFGPLGVHDWSEQIESFLARHNAGSTRLAPHNTPWYIGRPVIITANDYRNRVFNGDVGVVVHTDHGPSVALDGSDEPRLVAQSQLDAVDTWWAMTIHKSQGSEFRRVVVALPTQPSPILTRELLYTAVTRARDQVTVVASERALRAAVGRPVSRISGLRTALWPPDPSTANSGPLDTGAVSSPAR